MTHALVYKSKGRQSAYAVIGTEERNGRMGFLVESNTDVHGPIWILYTPKLLPLLKAVQKASAQMSLGLSVQAVKSENPILGSLDDYSYALRDNRLAFGREGIR